MESLAKFMVEYGLGLLAKAGEIWQAQGLDPAAFDRLVADARANRQTAVELQRAQELAQMDGDK